MSHRQHALEILQMLQPGNQTNGLRIATAANETPLTFKIEGTEIQLDADLFVVPEAYKPVKKGDQFFVLPILDQAAQRWGVIQRISGGYDGTYTTGDNRTATITDGTVTKVE